MKHQRVIAISILILLSVAAFAQKKEKKKAELTATENVKAQTETITKEEASKVMDTVNVVRQTPPQDSIIVLTPEQQEIISLKDSISVINALLVVKTDSLSLLKNEMEKRMVIADDAIVRLSYQRLAVPYNKEKVDQAVSEMDNLYSREMREKHKKVTNLLRTYGMHYDEIHSIIMEAQNDMDRTNPFSIPSVYIAKYQKRIEYSYYYREYYNEKVFTIKYLNGLIDDVLKALQTHSDSHPVDLSPYLN